MPKKPAVITVVVLAGIVVIAIAVLLMLRGSRRAGTQIGAVNTAFHWTGSDNITVESIEDPKVGNVVCELSRARVGGLKGTAGVAEDKSDADIACVLTGPPAFKGTLAQQEVISSEKLNVTTKTLRIVRIVDPTHNTLTYLAYSDKLVEGSPKHSMSTVAISRSTPIPLH